MALIRAYGPLLYQAVALKVIYDLLQFAGPALLSAIVTYLTDLSAGASGTDAAVGFGYVGLMAATAVTQTALLHQYFLRSFRTGLQLRTAVVSAVFRKALRLSVAARQSRTVGQVLNIASTDATRMRDLTTYLVMLESAPLQIALSVAFLWQQIGASVLTGVAVMVVFIPLNLLIARLQKKLQSSLMSIKDERVDRTSEAITAAKIIKLHAWESEVVGRISERRTEEVKRLWWYMLVRQLSTVLWVGLPLLVTLASFASFVWSGGELTAARAFTSLTLFSILRFPLSMLPSVINNVIEASVSVVRIESYLGSREVEAGSCSRVDPLGVGTGTGDADPDGPAPSGVVRPAVELRNASYSWSPPQRAEPTAAAPGSTSTAPSSAGKAEDNDEEEAGGGAAASGDAAARAVVVDADLSVARGQLVAIAGRVGSGKTSLLHAALGELHRLAGSAVVRGSVAYVAQTPFILNDTLQNNILFGRPLDRHRYKQVLHACCLEADLKELPGGDQTEIGERGINLSGGTRARVGLARAVYANADVYLLDDPLSAVDAHVGNNIFRRCILGLLKSKTRVLVTHGVPFMRNADHVVVMSSGRIVQQGTFADLLASSGQAISEIVSSYDADAAMVASAAHASHASNDEDEDDEDEDEEDDAADDVSEDHDDAAAASALSPSSSSAASTETASKPSAKQGAEAGRLISREQVGRGTVRLGVFYKYIEALGGPLAFTLFALGFAVAQGGQVAVNWWLTAWSNGVKGAAPSEAERLNESYLGGYAGLSALSIVLVIALRAAVAGLGIRAARRLHEQLVSTVQWAPMAFFDTTPVGRVVNRFSGDQYTVDEVLMPSIASLFSTLASVIGTIAVIGSATPLFLVMLVPLAAVYAYTQRYYVSTSRELQRLTSASRSPIIAQFGEALAGAVTVRAYADERRFRRLSDALLDTNQSAYFAGVAANRWLAVRLELVGALITTGSALFAVLARDSIDPSIAGLSISYALSITQTLNWSVRQLANVETQIVSVERIGEYCELETEDRRLAADPATGKPLSLAEAEAKAEAADPRLRGWPSRGEVRIEGLKLRYRKDTPLVLHGVDMKAAAGSKVGIVGRTGAGKSSMVSAFFRLAAEQRGVVEIDRVDVADVPLRILRSRIAIIPQEATLLTGTVRSNLDPFNAHSDRHLVHTLRVVGVLPYLLERTGNSTTPTPSTAAASAAASAAAASSASSSSSSSSSSHQLVQAQVIDDAAIPEVLELDVAEGGENLSAGTRQLLCVARALLRRCKVVVMDEASSAMDAATDAHLQDTMRHEFGGSTVFSIAHRLHTILDSTSVVVLDRGKVVETGPPGALLSDPSSAFASLVRDSQRAGEA